MRWWHVAFFFVVVAFDGGKSVCAQEDTAGVKVLFVYDTLDDKSSFFITTFREELTALPCTVDEAAVENSKTGDLSHYSLLVIYSRIMAFDMKSPVRKWIEGQKSFGKKKIALFVTTNRWFLEKHFSRLKDLLGKRNADVVDAVSMATKDLTDEQKKAWVRENLAKVVK